MHLHFWRWCWIFADVVAFFLMQLQSWNVVAFLSMLSRFCKFTVLWASVVVFLKFHILSCDAIKCLTYSSSGVGQLNHIVLCIVYSFGQNMSNKKRQFNYMRDGKMLCFRVTRKKTSWYKTQQFFFFSTVTLWKVIRDTCLVLPSFSNILTGL